jgi:hypothetical protein
MSVIQISKIQMRRGFEIDLPGAPITLNPPTFNPGLDVGEFGYAIDSGRLFIGHDPTTGMPNDERIQFPFQNVEVLTENSGNTLRRIHEGFHRFIGSGGFFQSTLSKVASAWTDVLVPQTNGDVIPFRINGSFLTANIEYFVMDVSQNPLRQGTLRILSQAGASETLMIDDCVSAPRLDLVAGDAVDPELVNSNVEFRVVRMGTNVDPHFRLQYQNIANVDCMFFFSVLRPVIIGPAEPFLGSVGGNTSGGSTGGGGDGDFGDVTVQKLTVNSNNPSTIKSPGTLYLDVTGLVLKNGNFLPSVSNAQDIGSSVRPFGSIYASDFSGNAASASKLTTARAIVLSGDVTASLSFDGSASLVVPVTLKNSGVTVGSWSKVTVDLKGRVVDATHARVADIANLGSTVSGATHDDDDLRAMRMAEQMPDTGTYSAGDMVFSKGATVFGATGSQYTILGWRRLTSGSTHTINDDWVEMRVSTGT